VPYYGSPGPSRPLTGVVLAHLAPAHGHGIYAVEEVSRTEGLGGAELLAAVFADEHDGEGPPADPELPSGDLPSGAILERV
jgi:hypothetical protein